MTFLAPSFSIFFQRATLIGSLAIALCVGSSSAALIGHWTLDESPTATNGISVADSSGATVHNGTLNTNDATNHAVGGQIGGAFDLGGGGDRVSASLGLDIVTGNAPVAVTAWFNPTSIGTRQNYIFSYGTNSAGQTFDMTLEDTNGATAGGVVLRYRHFGGYVNHVVPSVTTSSGWHHLAAVIPVGATTVGHAQFYLDGSLLTESGSTNTTNTLNIVSSTFQIGAIFNGATQTSFIGQLDDVGYWDEALDAGDIAAIYNGGLAGNDLQQSLIPEPAGATLIGLAGLLAIFRRRR